MANRLHNFIKVWKLSFKKEENGEIKFQKTDEKKNEEDAKSAGKFFIKLFYLFYIKMIKLLNLFNLTKNRPRKFLLII
jgi:hypothetical protein